MEARFFYIQNTNSPKDPAPEGRFYKMPSDKIPNLPNGFVAWKAYTNKEPTAKDIGMSKAALKAWLKEKNAEEQQGFPAEP